MVDRIKPKPKPAPCAKMVTLSPAHLDTIKDAFDYLIEELIPESASRSPVGLAKRITMKRLREVLRHIGG